MASKQGTIMATPPTTYGHDLLLDELITFLTTNAALVAAGQNWTLLNDNHAAVSDDRFVYLRGPGMAGNDQVYVQIRRFTITGIAQPVYNWEIRGAQGYDSSLSFTAQPGVSPKAELVLYDEDIPYWFFANGRRFVVNARILTIHTNCYCGLYLPYATSAELRYPLAIMGTTENTNLSYLSGLGNSFNGFFFPKTNNNYQQWNAAGHILKRDGTWIGLTHNQSSLIPSDQYRLGTVWPYSEGGMVVRPSQEGIISEFPICLLIHDFPARRGGSCYGELDGVRWVTGGPYTEQEDIIQIGSANYRVISDSGRISLNSMAAVLED